MSLSEQTKNNYFLKFLDLKSGRSQLYETEKITEKRWLEDIIEPMQEEVFPIIVQLRREEISGHNYWTKDIVLINEKFYNSNILIESGVAVKEKAGKKI